MDETVNRCGKGVDNRYFHIEMENVAAGKDGFLSLNAKSLQQSGSLLSLDGKYMENKSDVQPLTDTHACRYEECMKFHSVGKSDPESPASPLKNVSLYLVLLMLLIWIFVYTILSKMNYL